MVFELSKTNTIANHFLAELRDEQVQKDSLRFRRNLERLGEVMAYEVSKTLTYAPNKVSSVLGEKQVNLLSEQPILITIMRAGLPFYNGFLGMFDRAQSGFIGAYRVEKENEVSINNDYFAIGNLEGKEVIIVDPMLATGKSIVTVTKQLLKNGMPSRIHYVSAIAAPEGIGYLQSNLDLNYKIWVGSIDDRLNENAYIVPGLGDAGDLSFGKKI